MRSRTQSRYQTLLKILNNGTSKKLQYNTNYYQLITPEMNHQLDKTHDILHQNSIGQVTRCNCCNKIQILIGTTLMTVNRIDFDSCFNSLNQLATNFESATHVQKIYLRTPSNHVYIALSQTQFFEAIDLLKGASVLLEVKEILN